MPSFTMSPDILPQHRPKPLHDRQAQVPDVPGQRNIPFRDRKGGCPWPTWSAPETTGNVCGLPGDPKHPRTQWCAAHHAIVYIRPEVRKVNR